MRVALAPFPRWQVWELLNGRVVGARPGHATEAAALDRLPLAGPAVVTCNGVVCHVAPNTDAPQLRTLLAYAARHWLRLTPEALRPRCERCGKRPQAPPENDTPAALIPRCDGCRTLVRPEAPPFTIGPRCVYVASTGRACGRAQSPLAKGDDPGLADHCSEHRAVVVRRAERIAS